MATTKKNLARLGMDLHKKIDAIDHRLEYDLRSLGAYTWDSRLTSVSIHARASLKRLDSDIADMFDALIDQVNNHRGDKE